MHLKTEFESTNHKEETGIMEDQVLAIPNFEAAPERRRMFNRDFVLMWQGAFISYFGDIIYGLAISYWVLQTTGSTALMGLSLIHI